MKMELLKTLQKELYVPKIKFRHDTYREVRDGIVKEIREPCAIIRSNKNKLYAINFVKKTLSKMNQKRFVVSD